MQRSRRSKTEGQPATTRRSLHGIGELVLAGPQYRAHGTIRLRGDAALIAEWFARGDAGLRSFAPDVEPVIWPEHFDLAITLDEVNYGISPGDAVHPLPYAHVGPWTPRESALWNVPFGALQPAGDLPDADAVSAFFAKGRAAL